MKFTKLNESWYIKYESDNPPKINTNTIIKLIMKSNSLIPESGHLYLQIKYITTTLITIATASANIDPFTPHIGINTADKSILIILPDTEAIKRILVARLSKKITEI